MLPARQLQSVPVRCNLLSVIGVENGNPVVVTKRALAGARTAVRRHLAKEASMSSIDRCTKPDSESKSDNAQEGACQISQSATMDQAWTSRDVKPLAGSPYSGQLWRFFKATLTHKPALREATATSQSHYPSSCPFLLRKMNWRRL